MRLVFAIHFSLQLVQLQKLDFAWQPGIGDVTDLRLVCRNAGISQRRSLIDRRQEGGAPVVDAAVG